MEKRVIFPKWKQKEFLLFSKKELKLTWPEFAKKLNVNRKTLEKPYRYEMCSLPYITFIKIIKLRKLLRKDILKRYEAKVIDFIPVMGRSSFGERRVKLPVLKIIYKNPIPKFNTSQIEISKYDEYKNLKFPDKLTPDLAEEIGIHVGDGFLSKRKNEYRLKGNKHDEKDYYNSFIKNLYKKLFNLDLNIREYETTYGFELCSLGFWEFKNKILKLPAGRKDNMKLPEIVKVNDRNVLCAFIRGVFDTDGYITFKSRYGFKKYYPDIGIAMLSRDLINGIAEILHMLGLKPYKYQDKLGYWHITLNGYDRLEKYYKLVGWHNPKHLRKVKEWKRLYPQLSKEMI